MDRREYLNQRVKQNRANTMQMYKVNINDKIKYKQIELNGTKLNETS
jgi:hypothetical protein